MQSTRGNSGRTLKAFESSQCFALEPSLKARTRIVRARGRGIRPVKRRHLTSFGGRGRQLRCHVKSADALRPSRRGRIASVPFLRNGQRRRPHAVCADVIHAEQGECPDRASRLGRYCVRSFVRLVRALPFVRGGAKAPVSCGARPEPEGFAMRDCPIAPRGDFACFASCDANASTGVLREALSATAREGEAF